MILHQFPDLTWLKKQAVSRFVDRQGADGKPLKSTGWPSVVMHTKTDSTFRPDILGPLSIFTNLKGNSQVSVDKHRVTVTPETFFISNAHQHYTLEVNERAPTETFNIHFGEQFVEHATKSISASVEQLLQNPFDKTTPAGFHNRLVQKSNSFQSILKEIQNQGQDDLFQEEKFFQLLGLLVQEQHEVESMRTRITALKSSTKEEILKRILTATDYLYTYYDQNPSLDELARVCCLSKFHFLRLFKIAYGKTPHQFITELRMRRAKDLLQNSKMEVKTIAHQLGFEATSSFSRVSHSQFGVYPAYFRANS